MINYLFRLSVTIVLVHIGLLRTEAIHSRNGLEIWPNLTEFSLTPDTPEESRTLTCKGTEPIRWYFRKYDGTLLIKKNFSIKVFPSGENSYTYLALLSLSKATYLDTGFYICASSEKSYYHKDIYIYIHHKTHLLAAPEDFKPWVDQQNGTVFVPSRLTSADTNVTMTSDYDYISGESQVADTETCHPTKQFRCRNNENGTCLPDFLICDGYVRCIDESDEDPIMCEARTCGLSQPFRCTDGLLCQHEVFVCDGQEDCIDGSDEMETMCQARSCHPYAPFKCANGLKCISGSNVCDGENNCSDKSDEDQTTCQLAKMCNMKWQFKCNDFDHRNKLGFETRFNTTHIACLSTYTSVCNGIKNCGDGSDEDPAMCQKNTCSQELPFRCTSGQCISSENICDGRIDCGDKSDEDEHVCEKLRLDSIQFNEKIGFQMDLLPFINISFTSVARKNHITDNLRIPNPFDDLIHITDLSSGHVVISQNLTLNCSIEPIARLVFWTLEWNVPGKQENEHNETQNERIEYKPYNNGSVLLYIGNVSFDDAGDYICAAKAFNGLNFTKTYKLKAYPYDMNYTNLKIDDSIQKKIRPAGYESARWIITISSNGNTCQQWRGPNSRILDIKSANTRANNNNSVSELKITKLKLSDSGVYRLAAYNGDELNVINVTLIVEDKPTILFIEGLKSNQSYYGFGKNYTFVFYTSGYPLPSIECAFEKCPNYPKCEQPTETKHIESKTVQVSEITIKSIISMNVTETGSLVCNASNILGNHTKKYTILVTDVLNGMEIKGPSIILLGDNITIQCFVSLYNYIDEIKWNYPEDVQTQENLKITNSKTSFSYQSQLMITNVSNNFNGYVNCTANRMPQTKDGLTHIETKSFEVYIREPRVPVINNSSDTNHSMVVGYGEQVILQCSAIGMPHPTISWFMENQPWPFDGNYSRALMLSGNQTLLINFTEIEYETTYKCVASNKVGSADLSFLLKRNYMNNENLKKINNDNQSIDVVLFCIVIVILLAIVIIACVMGLKKEKTMINTMAVIEINKLEEGAVIPKNPNMGILCQWSFPLDKLEIGKRLGSGAFGVVYKAKAVGIIKKNTTTDVAVKTVNPNSDSCCIRNLESELKMMINIGRHLNIVNFLGLCTEDADKKLMIIVEYCRYGSIDQYMRKHRECFVNQFILDECINCDGELSSKNPIYENVFIDITKSNANIVADGVANPEGHSNTDGTYHNRNRKPLCTLDLIQWSYQAARGMDFLASKKILHGDLAARNVLLAENNIVKICDFGLSKSLSYSGFYKKKAKKDLLPFKWMAIESIKDLVFSSQSDVWSFGIVMWEMFSLAARPYPNLQLCDLYDKLLHGYRMEKPKYANSIIYDVMMDCWEAEPIKRPSFSDLTDRLDELLRTYTKSDYVNLNENLTETDPISHVTAPTYSNCFVTSENHSIIQL